MRRPLRVLLRCLFAGHAWTALDEHRFRCLDCGLELWIP